MPFIPLFLSPPLAVLMKCFNGFCKEGVVLAETVGEILAMMGLRVQKKALQDIITEVDEDGEDGDNEAAAEAAAAICLWLQLVRTQLVRERRRALLL